MKFLRAAALFAGLVAATPFAPPNLAPVNSVSSSSIKGYSSPSAPVVPTATTPKLTSIATVAKAGTPTTTPVVVKTTTKTVTATRIVTATKTVTSTTIVTAVATSTAVVTSTVDVTSEADVTSTAVTTSTVVVTSTGAETSTAVVTSTAVTTSTAMTTSTAVVTSTDVINSTTIITSTAVTTSTDVETSTATVTSTAVTTSTTVTTSTASAAAASSAPYSNTTCLTTDDATTLVNVWASLLTNYETATAEAYLSSDFTDTSDSINFLAGYPLGSTTFPSKAAFEAGQGSQPAIGFTVLGIDAVGCTSAAFRWTAEVGGPDPVNGINVFHASNLNGTDAGWQISQMFAEFNSGAWMIDIGGNCSLS